MLPDAGRTPSFEIAISRRDTMGGREPRPAGYADESFSYSARPRHSPCRTGSFLSASGTRRSHNVGEMGTLRPASAARGPAG